jgi:hypothetical protein
VWFKVDDQLHSHPKAVKAGSRAMGLWVRLGSWCGNHLTDGAFPESIVRQFDTDTEGLRSLVDAGLAEHLEGDRYQLHDFLDYNYSRKQAIKLKKDRARAGSKGGSKPRAKTKQKLSKCSSKSEAKGTGSGTGTGSRKKKEPTTVLPADFAPTDKHRQLAREHGVGLDLELVKFRAHYEGKRCARWGARLTKWIANAATYKQERAADNGGRRSEQESDRYKAEGASGSFDWEKMIAEEERQREEEERALSPEETAARAKALADALGQTSGGRDAH